MTCSIHRISIFLLWIAIQGLFASDNRSVYLHYLGHSSFLVRFANQVTIVTDFGISNVWQSDGYQSPIFGFGKTIPDIMTFSHRHADHFGGFMPPSSRIIMGEGPLSIKGPVFINGLTIIPIPAYERSLENPDNCGFLFIYDKIKILHTGDIQAMIIACETPEMIKRIAHLYPDRYDVVLVPIDFIQPITNPAVAFIKQIHANVVIPMHAWSRKAMDDFMSIAAKLLPGKKAIVEKGKGAEFLLFPNRKNKSLMHILSLEPAAMLTD